ncbi:hypothetical protein AGMMS50256_28850 [Betaproteobacteria bacterium]|nr:hypothetical protein AGMMS50256_28850 [Betaproteobacteria bacterium]
MGKSDRSKLARLLVVEEGFVREHAATQTAKRLEKARNNLLKHVREVGKSGDLAFMVETEKNIVQGDLDHYANSKSMISSLNAALSELNAIEGLLAIVDDKNRYEGVNKSHILPRNREKDLPLDEARQAFKSHYTRLNNLDKSRLSADEKSIIDTRKSNILNAGKLYAQRQAKTLDIA